MNQPVTNISDHRLVNNGHSLTETLKKRTRYAHDEIERNKAIKSLFGKQFTTDDYFNLLSGFYGYYQPLEHAIEDSLQVFSVLDFDYVNKSKLILKDLKNLHKKNPDDENWYPDIALTNFKISCIEELVGRIYVIEGACMGGQLISKHLKQKFGEHVSEALSFYAYPNTGVMKHWQRVKNCIDGIAENKDFNTDVAVNAAINTFEGLNLWLAASYRSMYEQINQVN